MSAVEAPLIPELEDALRQISADRHAETVQNVTDLFVAGAARFNELHVTLFDRILGRLIAVMDSPALVELARRLAPIANAPPDVLRLLAHNDAIAVASPVLTRSVGLDDQDLIDVASTQSQAHLFAISGRSSLSEAVTDVLIACGDRDVVRNVAMNHRARLSPTGRELLAERAVKDHVLAEKLARRNDVPSHEARSFFSSVGNNVQESLEAAAAVEASAEFEDVAIDMPAAANDAEEDAQAWPVVGALHAERRLDEGQVLEFARTGRDKEIIAALALICDLSADVVRQLLTDDRRQAAFILCQAAGFSAPTAHAIAASRDPAAASDFDASGGIGRLSPATAQRIVGFWRACHDELRAAS
jgi:uncharacterized protein (DUF2336 family)